MLRLIYERLFYPRIKRFQNVVFTRGQAGGFFLQLMRGHVLLREAVKVKGRIYTQPSAS
jgi:hypothetical protein